METQEILRLQQAAEALPLILWIGVVAIAAAVAAVLYAAARR